jgi:hypothetical protein
MSVFKIENGDLVRGTSFLRVDGAEEIAQGVDARLQKLEGEDPWNLADGTRWLDLILRKGVPEASILGELERRILSQPGMLTVETLELERLSERRVAVAWTGTASTSQLAAVLRVQGKTEIAA